MPEVLAPLQEMAGKRLEAVGFPNAKDELWRYVRPRRFVGKEWPAHPSPPLTPRAGLVFVNGAFAPELSNCTLPKGVVWGSFEEVGQPFAPFIAQMMGRREENNPYVSFATSLTPNGLWIYLPPNMVVEEPVPVFHYLTGGHAYPLIAVRLSRGASLKLVCTTEATAPGLCSSVLHYSLEENAHFHLMQEAAGLPFECVHMEAVRGHQKGDSTFRNDTLTTGSQCVRNDWQIDLAGSGAETHLQGFSRLDGEREAHNLIQINHIAPHCRSEQLFRGVLSDRSRSSFEGKIYVCPEALKTEAYQLNQNLLLSDTAHVYSKPNLEIFADDVKASHGATVGQLDLDQLFYLRARGLSEQEAKKWLTWGFYQEHLAPYPSAIATKWRERALL